jgi:hypothetical protein
MAGPFFWIGLALLLAGLGRIGLSDWQGTLLSWTLLGLGGAFMFVAMIAAIFKRRRSSNDAGVVPQTAIDQNTHGSHSPAIAQGSGTQHIHIYPATLPTPLPSQAPNPELSTKTLPKVIAVRYGLGPNGSQEGLYLENDGETVFEVQPEPLIIGQGIVRFALVNTLKKDAFSMATIEVSEGHGSFQLDPVWRKAMEEQKEFGLEMPLLIVYRNYEGQWFRCVCKFERNTHRAGSWI